jgi:hypothetical protein
VIEPICDGCYTPEERDENVRERRLARALRQAQDDIAVWEELNV